MADYDSDSSAGDDIQTNVLLGYASKEPTGDDFSQLGGRPKWIHDKSAPSGALAKCKVCNGVTSLLLQLNGDLPDWFPDHERRLYIFECRRKPCRRKAGSVRALRGTRVIKNAAPEEGEPKEQPAVKPNVNIGDAIFGANSAVPTQANPFASLSSSSASANPFSTTKTTSSQTAKSELSPDPVDLPLTFAQKAWISSTSEEMIKTPPEPWTDDPNPYPAYYLDAEQEHLEPEPKTAPSGVNIDAEGGAASAAEEKALFESSMDKTFQTFADTLAQNPEQVLRYEFRGHPLLYSSHDTIGKLSAHNKHSKIQTASSKTVDSSAKTFAMPRCPTCGAVRVFELQLTPNAITELESEETGIDGMDWGTIILGVCSDDCTPGASTAGEVHYAEEWIGVQWEELVQSKRQ